MVRLPVQIPEREGRRDNASGRLAFPAHKEKHPGSLVGVAPS